MDDETLEQRARSGDISVDELTILGKRRPSLIKNLGLSVFSKEIDIWSQHALVYFMNGSYTSFFNELKYAESFYNEARNYEIDISPTSIEETFMQAYENAKDNFKCTVRLFEYSRESSIESISKYEDELRESTEVLANKEARSILKKARSTAKMSMKKGRIERLLEDFNKLAELGTYGYNYPDEKEEDLREVAYKKGVLFNIELIDKFRETNPERARKAYAMALHNVHLLGRELDYNLD